MKSKDVKKAAEYLDRLTDALLDRIVDDYWNQLLGKCNTLIEQWVLVHEKDEK